MRLSYTAIELCAIKYGKGQPLGFETLGDVVTETFSEQDAERLYDELTQSEMVSLSEEDAHLSALGRYVIGMMTQPDMFISLNNELLGVVIRIYVRDVYYLCTIEHKVEQQKGNWGQVMVEPLPDLKLVVSAFAYALHWESASGSATKETSARNGDYDVHITAISFDDEGASTTKVEVYGVYQDGSIHCRTSEICKSKRMDSDEQSYEVSDLINKLTRWVFDMLSETMESAGD